jgi:dihydroorotate dehydrogenase electron transfer subunit
MLKKVSAKVRDNKEIANNIFRMTLVCEDADLVHFVPGQFANIAVPGHNELLLKRPISICTVDASNYTISLVYQVKGKGTQAFSELGAGTNVEAILPVGRGFNLKATEKNIFLVGGGVGIAPLLSVTQKWPEKNYEAFLGYRGKDYEYCLDDFRKACGSVYVTSDDGTLGEKGLVTEPLAKRLKETTPDVILACGPTPMLRALQNILKPLGISAQFSMEQRMCCGFGACATCVCGIDHGNGLEYEKVCVEGPVFDAYEVAL